MVIFLLCLIHSLYFFSWLETLPAFAPFLLPVLGLPGASIIAMRFLCSGLCMESCLLVLAVSSGEPLVLPF